VEQAPNSILSTLLTSPAELTGLAASETRLYASDPYAGKVRVYDANTMALQASWSIPRAGQMALDASGLLWVVQNGSGTTAPRVLGLDPGTGAQRSVITVASGAQPHALGMDAVNHRLLVTDFGRDQNVKIYNPANLSGTPTAVAGTFGVTGGAFAGSGSPAGTAGPLRFIYPSGVGADAAGNLYVACGGNHTGTVLESYRQATGQRNWALYSLEYIDEAGADPGSQSDVYTRLHHYVMNYNNTAPGGEWSYAGATLNPFKYPDDPRLHAMRGGTGWPPSGTVARGTGPRMPRARPPGLPGSRTRPPARRPTPGSRPATSPSGEPHRQSKSPESTTLGESWTPGRSIGGPGTLFTGARASAGPPPGRRRPA
jgi:hypothetical protein